VKRERPAARPIRRPRAGLQEAAPRWRRYCGWCGGTWPVVTDGRNLVCSHCGH